MDKKKSKIADSVDGSRRDGKTRGSVSRSLRGAGAHGPVIAFNLAVVVAVIDHTYDGLLLVSRPGV